LFKHYNIDLLPINQPYYEPSNEILLTKNEQRSLLIGFGSLMHAIDNCIFHFLDWLGQKIKETILLLIYREPFLPEIALDNVVFKAWNLYLFLLMHLFWDYLCF
jgi:hypothetical protein